MTHVPQGMSCRSRPWALGCLCVAQHELGTTVSVPVYRHCRNQRSWRSSCDNLLTYVISADGMRELDGSKSGPEGTVSLSLWFLRRKQSSRVFPGPQLSFDSNTSASVFCTFPGGCTSVGPWSMRYCRFPRRLLRALALYVWLVLAH